MYVSWCHGATILSNSLVEVVNVVRKAWGKGDVNRAITLTEVCIQPMMSIWYRNFYAKVGGEFSDDQKREQKQTAMSNVFMLLGIGSNVRVMDGKVSRFLNLDAQWNYQEDHREEREKQGEEGTSLWYSTLLTSMIQRALGYKGFINWRKQTFPVTQHSDLCFKDEGTPFGLWGFSAFYCTMQLEISVFLAAASMFRFYR